MVDPNINYHQEWLREDDVEWPQILRLLDYIYSTKGQPETLFSKIAMSLDLLVWVSEADGS